jgi:UDP-2,4-diacetamido-2,4,6-trideoxy-beta-L-altropyranose hydrolase
MKKLAIFRCDASPAIGAGHAARCLALADAFADAGYEILFALRKGSLDTAPDLTRYDHAELDGGEAEELDRLGILLTGKNSIFVLDHRERGAAYETVCRKFASRIVTITDFPDAKHDCDVLVDQTIGRDAEEYASLVPANCKALTGAQHALVGKSFLSRRGEAEERRRNNPGQRVLLAFGATDPFNYLGRLLPSLMEQTPDLSFTIAAGSRPLDDVKALCETHTDRISVVRAAKDMPRAILEADLAVGLAGTSAWERCVLGVPAALFIPSDYYRLATERLAATGAGAIVGSNDFDPAQASRKIVELAKSEATLAQMSARALALCDGEGASRIVNALC